MNSTTSLRLALLTFAPLALIAQSTAPTFRPVLIETLAASYSYSSPSRLVRGGSFGEVSVHRFEASTAGRRMLNADVVLSYGVAFAVNELATDPTVPLPDRLGELTFNVGANQRWSPRWSGSLFLRPGIYSDLQGFSGDAINIPALALASYATSADLVWMFGVALNPLSERIVMPVAGVRWKFAPEWTLNIGFPRLGVSWEIEQGLTLRAGLSVQGGSYQLTENLGSPAPGVANLEDTPVQYREVRLGVGADLTVSETLSLTGDLGVMADRRFEYHERDFTLNGESAFFLSLGVKSRF